MDDLEIELALVRSRTDSGKTIQWLANAAFLSVGSRMAALQADGATIGKVYAVAYSKWLYQHPVLRDINKADRVAGLWCLRPENWPTVEDYLDGLTEKQLLKTTVRGVKAKVEDKPKKETRVNVLLRENEQLRDRLKQFEQAAPK